MFAAVAGPTLACVVILQKEGCGVTTPSAAPHVHDEAHSLREQLQVPLLRSRYLAFSQSTTVWTSTAASLPGH